MTVISEPLPIFRRYGFLIRPRKAIVYAVEELTAPAFSVIAIPYSCN